MCFGITRNINMNIDPPTPPRREDYGNNITKYIAAQTRYQKKFEKYMDRQKPPYRVIRPARPPRPQAQVDGPNGPVQGKSCYYHPSRGICWY